MFTFFGHVFHLSCKQTVLALPRDSRIQKTTCFLCFICFYVFSVSGCEGSPNVFFSYCKTCFYVIYVFQLLAERVFMFFMFPRKYLHEAPQKLVFIDVMSQLVQNVTSISTIVDSGSPRQSPFVNAFGLTFCTFQFPLPSTITKWNSRNVAKVLRLSVKMLILVAHGILRVNASGAGFLHFR